MAKAMRVPVVAETSLRVIDLKGSMVLYHLFLREEHYIKTYGLVLTLPDNVWTAQRLRSSDECPEELGEILRSRP
jgi:hypothetical protein